MDVSDRVQSPLLWIGVVIFCAGCGLGLVHQEKWGPDRARWMDYLMLAVVVAGNVVFVLGAGLSATG